jgi:hypothetical protein
MNERPPSLSLLIVSDDWFARPLLRDLARDCGHFRSIAITGGDVPVRPREANVFLFDRHSLGRRADAMIAGLRADPATRACYIAALEPEPIGCNPHVDFANPTEPGTAALAPVIACVGLRALLALQTRRAA